MQHFRTARSVLAGSVVLLAAAVAGAQTTWYVDLQATPPGNGSPGNPYASIQYAIDQPATVNGDTLLVAPGTYVENIAYHAKNIVVRSSAGPETTILQPAAPGPIAHLSGDVFSARLEGFTIRGLLPGTTWPDAAVVLFSGSLRGCIVRDNTQGTGIGVISLYDGELTDCTVTRNARGILAQSSVVLLYLRNTITWGNSQEDLDLAGSISPVNYCAGGLDGPANNIAGVGNLEGDPGLWSVDEGDLHLRPGSVCIDAGDPNFPLDPDGSRHDIGALAFDSSYAPGPVAYCTAKANSQGCAPQIGFSGHATASGTAPFVIAASNEIPGKVGLLFYGPGKRFQPFQGGVHCVQLPTKRVGVQIAGGVNPCEGTYSFDFAAYAAAGTHPQVFPGALLACQWWSRDPLDPLGFGTALSNALYFGVAID